MSRCDCAHAVAYKECVCAIPLIFFQCLYKTACVNVSDDGRNFPFTTLPSKSTITIFPGDNSAYGTPLGLIAKTPSFLSAALTLPKVKLTKPSFGSSRLAS